MCIRDRYDALTREECEAIRENDGYVRGLREGEASGEARGEAKEKLSIARNMLKMGMDIKVISEATGLTEEMCIRDRRKYSEKYIERYYGNGDCVVLTLCFNTTNRYTFYVCRRKMG